MRFPYFFTLGYLLFAVVEMRGQTTVTIATVNNGDMIVMQKLSKEFERQHPDIQLDWVVLEEKILREKTTTDAATQGAQYDVVTIGPLEAPIWGQRGWLTPLNDKLSATYDLADLLKPIRDGASWGGKLYALPFYGESSLTYYRKDLFREAGLEMPAQPTYDDIERFAKALNDPVKGVYGICLRGKPGWGENMAYISTLANTFGGRWFDEDWTPQLDSPEWHAAVSFYVSLLQKYGPPGVSSNGFNESLTLFENGRCGMWIDATVAAGSLYDSRQSNVAGKVGFAAAPVSVTPRGAQWLWFWALAVPFFGETPRSRSEVYRMGNIEGLHQAGCQSERLGRGAFGNEGIDLPAAGIFGHRSVCRTYLSVDHGRRPASSHRKAGAVHRYSMYRDSGISYHWRSGGAMDRGGSGRRYFSR